MSEGKRYVCIDGVNYAVHSHIKYTMICKRGFLFGKRRKPEVMLEGKHRDWTSEKEIMQALSENFKTPWPVQLRKDGCEEWDRMVFETSDKIVNPNLPLVDCTVVSSK